LGLIPSSYIVLALALPLFFFTFFVIIRPDGVRCIISYALFAIYSFCYCPIPGVRYGSMLIAAIVIIKHILGYENTKVSFQFGPWQQLKNAHK